MGPSPETGVPAEWHAFPDHASASWAWAMRPETPCRSLSGQSSIDDPIAASDRDRRRTEHKSD
jgi:hypothetical protein